MSEEKEHKGGHDDDGGLGRRKDVFFLNPTLGVRQTAESLCLLLTGSRFGHRNVYYSIHAVKREAGEP